MFGFWFNRFIVGLLSYNNLDFCGLSVCFISSGVIGSMRDACIQPMRSFSSLSKRFTQPQYSIGLRFCDSCMFRCILVLSLSSDFFTGNFINTAFSTPERVVEDVRLAVAFGVRCLTLAA
jgi:hypothetical protein